jgi:hypothetical protein
LQSTRKLYNSFNMYHLVSLLGWSLAYWLTASMDTLKFLLKSCKCMLSLISHLRVLFVAFQCTMYSSKNSQHNPWQLEGQKNMATNGIPKLNIIEYFEGHYRKHSPLLGQLYTSNILFFLFYFWNKRKFIPMQKHITTNHPWTKQKTSPANKRKPEN